MHSLFIANYYKLCCRKEACQIIKKFSFYNSINEEIVENDIVDEMRKRILCFTGLAAYFDDG